MTSTDKPGEATDIRDSVGSDTERLDAYPLYEINISKGSEDWTEGSYSVDYVETEGEYPLMVSEDGSYRKVNVWPWVRDLQDVRYPLSYTPTGSDTPVVIPFEDDTTYFVRIRALSHVDGLANKGAWSNTQSVHIDLNEQGDFPWVARTRAPLRNFTYEQNQDIIDTDGEILINEITGVFGLRTIYLIYYQFPASMNAEERESARIIEVLESTDPNFDTVRQSFYLDTTNPASFSLNGDNVFVLRRSPYDNVLSEPENVHRPEFGETYYYKARFINEDLEGEATPDRLDDSRPSLFGPTVRVDVPENTTGSSSASWHG